LTALAMALQHEVGNMIPSPPITETHVAPDGRVHDAPETLARIASAFMGRPVSLDVYALARMGRSETDASHAETFPLRIHVCLNDLADLNSRKHLVWTPADLVTYSTQPTHRGFFGEQHIDRRYASTKDPLAADVAAVEMVLSDRAEGIDPTHGALKFVDKLSMGKQTGSGSFDALAASWAAEGLRPGTVEGMPDHFVVFRRRTA
jgi:hypothetical protein